MGITQLHNTSNYLAGTDSAIYNKACRAPVTMRCSCSPLQSTVCTSQLPCAFSTACTGLLLAPVSHSSICGSTTAGQRRSQLSPTRNSACASATSSSIGWLCAVTAAACNNSAISQCPDKLLLRLTVVVPCLGCSCSQAPTCASSPTLMRWLLLPGWNTRSSTVFLWPRSFCLHAKDTKFEQKQTAECQHTQNRQLSS